MSHGITFSALKTVENKIFLLEALNGKSSIAPKGDVWLGHT